MTPGAEPELIPWGGQGDATAHQRLARGRCVNSNVLLILIRAHASSLLLWTISPFSLISETIIVSTADRRLIRSHLNEGNDTTISSVFTILHVVFYLDLFLLV